jgi:adenine specific DNA methylase Mod
MDGYLDLLARAQKQMYSINEQFDNAVSDDDSYLSELRKKRREAEDYRNNLLADVECLQRLAGDKRMIDAYSLLADQQFTEEQRSGLIYAAWAARIDYTKYRDRVKAAKALRLQISNAAAALSQLLQDFSATGIDGPIEFYSIPDLLRATVLTPDEN